MNLHVRNSGCTNDHKNTSGPAVYIVLLRQSLLASDTDEIKELLPTSTTWDFCDGSPAVTGTLTPTHIYADNGAYTATLTFAYPGGAEFSDTVLITVDNVDPILDLGEDASVALNSALLLSGSFTDPGADTWTATVDYGDGAGAQPLTLTGTTFELEHTYVTPGTYTLSVTVSDDDGAGSA